MSCVYPRVLLKNAVQERYIFKKACRGTRSPVSYDKRKMAMVVHFMKFQVLNIFLISNISQTNYSLNIIWFNFVKIYLA